MPTAATITRSEISTQSGQHGPAYSLQGVRASYRPGEAVTGTVAWRADPPPRAIVIKLFWVTSGAAPRQVGVVAFSTVERLNPGGTSHFEFRLPEGPWSFEGGLVRLAWAIEAVLLPSKQNAHVMFSVGAEEGPVQVYPKEEALAEDD